MPELRDLVVHVKTRGLWKLAVLAFLLKRSRTHIVHVHLIDTKGRQTCVPTTQVAGLTGQAAAPDQGVKA